MIQLDTSWLQHVQKPARYTGGEYNSIVKDHSTVDITMALGFPDVYEVAMSHLGIKILYGLVKPVRLLRTLMYLRSHYNMR